MPYEIVRNDITRMAVDAIVNTANPRAVIGSGTDYAIHQAAGPALLAARQKLGDIAVGDCAATPAFGLPAKYVLHTVSPAWQDGKHREEELLRRAYDAALHLALKLKCRSVAVPLLSAGSYGFPRDKALLIAVSAVAEFTLRHRMRIYLVVFDAEAFSLAGGMFSGLKSYVDDNYVARRTEAEYRRSRYGGEPGKTRVRQAGRSPGADEDTPCRADTAIAAAPVPTAFLYAAKAPAFTPGMSLEELMGQSVDDFREYLRRLLRESGEKDPEVYHRASISRQLFNKILNKQGYLPSKTTILQLAIGLRLDVEKTTLLLEKAGYALSRSSKVDVVVRYYIENRTYNVQFINIALAHYGLPLLGVS